MLEYCFIFHSESACSRLKAITSSVTIIIIIQCICRRELHGDNSSPTPSVPANLESISNHPSLTCPHPHPSPHKLLPFASPLPCITACPHLCPRHQILLKPARVQKYSYATKQRKCDTLRSSKVQQMVQYRLSCHKKDTWCQCWMAAARRWLQPAEIP